MPGGQDPSVDGPSKKFEQESTKLNRILSHHIPTPVNTHSIR